MISDGDLKKGLMTLNIIWFAMLILLAIYLFVGLQVAENLRTSLDSDTFTILKSILYILAFITLVVTRYIRKFLLSPKGSNKVATQNTRYPIQHPAVGKYATAMIVAWAMSESIGIYGLMLFYLGACRRIRLIPGTENEHDGFGSRHPIRLPFPNRARSYDEATRRVCRHLFIDVSSLYAVA